MKHFNLLAVFFLISATAWCQETPEPPKTTTVVPSQSDVGEDVIVLDFHNDLWLEAPEDMDIRNFGLGFNFAFMKEYQMGKAPLFFAWGLGFSSHNVHHNGTFEYDEEEDFTEFTPLPEGYDYDKNKLSVNYIEVPLEFRFRTQNKAQFRIYAGFKGGAMVNVHSKIVEGDKKYKVTGLENTARFRYGPTVRIGIKKFGLFGFYSLSELFEPGDGVELIPVSIGISLFLP